MMLAMIFSYAEHFLNSTHSMMNSENEKTCIIYLQNKIRNIGFQMSFKEWQDIPQRMT